MRKILLAAAFLFTGFILFAGKVDTASIFSRSMNKAIRCVIILPENATVSKTRFPVVYLLHGYSDNYSMWIRQKPELKGYADRMHMIIVCPDGGFSSWYFDSPVDPAYRYETHVAQEVVQYVDGHYPTLPDRAHRAITGLSMGGHGALYLALRHPETFGAAGSMSGGVDLPPFPKNWDIAQRIGDIETHRVNWEAMSVVNMIRNRGALPQAFAIECGIGDFFLQVNRELHREMLELGIPHDYTERPGEHTWTYWKNAVEYQLLFFRNYFDGKQKISK
jgi:S-formylglutathione hydrolase FrmB